MVVVVADESRLFRHFFVGLSFHLSGRSSWFRLLEDGIDPLTAVLSLQSHHFFFTTFPYTIWISTSVCAVSLSRKLLIWTALWKLTALFLDCYACKNFILCFRNRVLLLPISTEGKETSRTRRQLDLSSPRRQKPEYRPLDTASDSTSP